MDGSHPEETSDFSVTDPTSKRNLVKEPRIPPQRKFREGEQESKRSGSWSSNCSPPQQKQLFAFNVSKLHSLTYHFTAVQNFP